MFFENEKDIARDGADLQVSDDGTITWDDVLDVSDDDVADKDTSLENNNVTPDKTGEITDEEFAGMLDDTSDVADNTSNANSDDFDLDRQLENISTDGGNDDNVNSDFKIPEKKKSKGSGSMTFLIALLFGILLAGGAYYGYTYFNEQGVSGDDLQRNQSVEDVMNNTTSEDIAQRTENQEEGIPVVNEDETDEIKPDVQEEEPKTEEKKEVITVIPTGRPNPFVPIAKYLKVEIPEVQTVVQYDKAKITQPPLEFAKEDPATKKMTTIAVSGIMYDEQKPSAIITFENNDYFVQRGDKLDDYKVVDIAKNSVTIAYGKNLYKANVGEEFKLTEFYGNAKYLGGDSASGRQYYSIKDNGNENQNIKKPNSRYSEFAEYVSDSDVTIRTR